MTTTSPAVAPPLRFCAIIDTETQGVDHKIHHTIEVAVQLFDVKLGKPVDSLSCLIKANGNPAVAINGISSSLLENAREPEEVWRAVNWLIKPAQVMVAHFANFDREFCPPFERPWVCSANDLVFPGERESRSLVALALSLGLGVASAHRAMADVDTLSRIFSRVHEMGFDLEKMLHHGLRPKLRCVSLAPFEQKDIVKSHGFSWNPDLKQWWRDVPIDDIDKLPFKVRRGTLPTSEGT